MRDNYFEDFITTFEVDSEGQPTKGNLVFNRLDYLEKYCWETRIEK